jgi:hypothetical protein
MIFIKQDGLDEKGEPDMSLTREYILNAKEIYLLDEDTLYVVTKEDNVYGLYKESVDWFEKRNFYDYFDSSLMLAHLDYISKEKAIELLCDDLRIDGSYQFNNRILKAENPAEEVATIIDELTVVVIGMIIDELNNKYNELKNKKSGFEWL